MASFSTSRSVLLPGRAGRQVCGLAGRRPRPAAIVGLYFHPIQEGAVAGAVMLIGLFFHRSPSPGVDDCRGARRRYRAFGYPGYYSNPAIADNLG